nr:hypothetical protein [Tanacetum cinerariifolium]
MGVALDEKQLLFIAGGQDNAVDEDVDVQPVQDLALNVDNVFQADEAPTAQTMFMANLSSANPIYDEAGSSYDSDILSEVHDHDYYQDAICENHEVYEMHDDVQPNYVVNSHTNYTSDSNMIQYDQYVKENAVPVVQMNLERARKRFLTLNTLNWMAPRGEICRVHGKHNRPLVIATRIIGEDVDGHRHVLVNDVTSFVDVLDAIEAA